MHCLNFGIANDQTQNILWRIENGEIDFEADPKVVVLLIGTNNTARNTVEEIVEAILEIICQIRKKLSRTHIIVIEIPPRGRDPNPLREKIAKINKLLEENITTTAGNDSKVTFLCCSKSNEFVSSQDGTISHTDMYDYLNFTNEGYRKFCEPIVEEINGILAKKSTSQVPG